MQIGGVKMKNKIRKLAEVSNNANVKIIGIYRAIDKFTVDKNFKIEELLDEIHY